MKDWILEVAKDKFLFFDGGCGTILQAAGLQAGEYPETWNRKRPEVITKLHYDYLMAGANILKTNTFGANCLKFPEGEGEDSLEEVIRLAVKNARDAIAMARETAEKEGIDIDGTALSTPEGCAEMILRAYEKFGKGGAAHE